MRIFLTGATGFVGSSLTEVLVERGHDVTALVRKTSDRRRLSRVAGAIAFVTGDLSSASDAVSGHDAIAHIAWGGVGNAARNDPQQFDNVATTVRLAEAAGRAGIPFVALGSQAEYGPSAAPTSIDAPTRPTTYYGMAKLTAATASAAACARFGNRFAWLRLFSSYGPGDDPAWMIPYLAISLLRGERPALTAGEQRWDYIFVRDAAEAIATVIERGEAAGFFNLGSGEARPLRSIVEAIRDLIDPALPLGFGEVPYRPDQVMHLEADVGPLRALGWAPRTSLERGLAETVASYRFSER